MQQQITQERRRIGRDHSPIETFMEIDIKEILAICWRHRNIIGGVAIAVFSLTLTWLVFQTPVYQAKTILQINSRNTQVFNSDIASVIADQHLGQDAMAMQSEVDILTSPYLAGRVVDKLRLTENKEFNPALNGLGLLGTIKSWFSSKSMENPAERAEYIRRLTINSLRKNYGASLSPRSLTINITAKSEDARLSAIISNAIAEEYLKDQLENYFKVTKDTSDWLNKRLDELRTNLAASELTVQQYREENNLFNTSAGLTVNDQQLSELNSQLILARTDLAEAKAKLRQSRKLVGKGTGADSAVEVLQSPLIQKLREMEAQLWSKEADLATRYGPKHPEIIKIRAEKKDLSSKIKGEIRKIFNSLENEVAITQTRVEALEKGLEGAQKKVGESSAAEIKLDELIREMETNRTLYESFLSRSKETSQQQDLEQANARIVSPAGVPLSPSFPRKKIVAILGLIIGLGLGCTIAFTLEYLDDSFRTLEQLERMGRYAGLGIVPMVPEGKNPLEYFREKPTSLFAESLRRIQTAVHFSNPNQPPQAIMITSSVTAEGKTLLSLSLAQAAARAGLKVIVLDADMRRPMASKYTKLNIKHTLADVLAGKIEYKKALVEDKNSGFSVLLSKPDTEDSNRLLSSKEMDKLLDTLKKDYDIIILDTPPLGALVDALNVARKVDSTIFVARWGKTSKKMAVETMRQLRMHRLPVAGLVLSQVDLVKDSKYGYGGYYRQYSSYYTD